MKNVIPYLVALLCGIALCSAQSAAAQLGRGDFRLSLDTDMLSVAHVSIDPDGPAQEYDTTIFGVGPNQLGGAHAIDPPATPLGLGLAWVITSKLLIGARVGLGFDVVAPEGANDNTKVLALSLMPGLTWVPIGHRAKLFVDFRPLFQVNRVKTDDDKSRWILGGFSTGIGALIFAASSVSVDLGFFFEGRFGGQRVENDAGDETRAHAQDLRGVVRLGISLWK